MSKILIFGATGGIGSALATSLVAAGRSVHLAGRDEAELSALAHQLGASYSLFDAFDEASLTSAVQQATADSGMLDGLVWAVGSILLKPLTQLSAADFTNTYWLNTIAPALAVKAALPALKSAEGSVVLFSSVAATQGFTAHAAIGSAKAGVEGLTRALAAELAPHIRVNAIAPSLSMTKMAKPITDHQAMAKGLAQAHPLGRLGQPDDMAAMAQLMLAKDSWMTGSVVAIDGGRSSLRVKG